MSGDPLQLCESCRRHFRAGESCCPFCGGRGVSHRHAARDNWSGIRLGRVVVGVSSLAVTTLGACAVYGAPSPFLCGGACVSRGGTGGSPDAATGGTAGWPEIDAGPSSGGFDAGPSCGAAPEAGPEAGLACPSGSTKCGDLCVPDTDPAYGCGAPACQPCNAPPGAASCASGACVVSSCPAGFLDCDGNPANGCETNATADAHNCGWCGHDCQGTACNSSGGCDPELLLGPNAVVDSLAVDDTSVYFTEDEQAGKVVRIPRDGGAPVVLASSQRYPSSLAIDATDVYWVTNGDVMKVAKSGGVATLIASGARTIALDDNDVFLIGDQGCGPVVKIPKSGGVPVVLANTDSGLYDTLAVDATSVYWTDQSWGAVMKVAKSGGPPVMLASGLEFPAIVVDASGVYCSDPHSGRVIKVPPGGGRFLTLATGLDSPGALAIDGSYVYIGTGSGILRVPKAGGPVLPLGNYIGSAYPMVARGSFLYLAGTDTVARIAK